MKAALQWSCKTHVQVDRPVPEEQPEHRSNKAFLKREEGGGGGAIAISLSCILERYPPTTAKERERMYADDLAI